MDEHFLNELNLLKEYDEILEKYDINNMKIESDPDLKRMDEILKQLEKGD